MLKREMVIRDSLRDKAEKNLRGMLEKKICIVEHNKMMPEEGRQRRRKDGKGGGRTEKKEEERKRRISGEEVGQTQGRDQTKKNEFRETKKMLQW